MGEYDRAQDLFDAAKLAVKVRYNQPAMYVVGLRAIVLLCKPNFKSWQCLCRI